MVKSPIQKILNSVTSRNDVTINAIQQVLLTVLVLDHLMTRSCFKRQCKRLLVTIK
jgi:hypothetical protein